MSLTQLLAILLEDRYWPNSVGHDQQPDQSQPAQAVSSTGIRSNAMKNTSRGSTKGLVQHHKDKEQSTQDALLRACRELGNDKPHGLWTKTELWKRAGLKSGMALSNPRHANIVVLFEQHNAAVRAAMQDGSTSKGEPTTVRGTLRALREQIAALTTQRDLAASWNAVYQQEALHYKQQLDDLLVLNTRLEAERDEWRAKLFNSNKPKST